MDKSNQIFPLNFSGLEIFRNSFALLLKIISGYRILILLVHFDNDPIDYIDNKVLCGCMKMQMLKVSVYD